MSFLKLINMGQRIFWKDSFFPQQVANEIVDPDLKADLL